jgi:catalase
MNNQRDGHMRQTINSDKTSYEPNTISNGCPFQAKMNEGGFSSFQERIDSKKIRERSSSFFDHFSQATLFYNSQSEVEKDHLMNALRFELGKVTQDAIVTRMLYLISKVDKSLARQVADGLGMKVIAQSDTALNQSVPADADIKKYQPKTVKLTLERSEALSMANTRKNTIKSRQVAVLAANGVNIDSIIKMKAALEAEGAQCRIIAPKGGELSGKNGKSLKPDHTLLTTASVLFDALYLPAGMESAKTLIEDADAVHFINEAFKHCKPIAAEGEGIDLLKSTHAGNKIDTNAKEMNLQNGILLDRQASDFVNAIKQHRFWEREKLSKVPA